MKKNTVLIFMLLCLLPGISQAQSELQLYDQSNKHPIGDASYTYGSYSGISDKNGIIYLEENDIKLIQFSHVSYGVWELKGDALAEALNTGISYREPMSNLLYPVSIIAVHSQQNEAGELKLNYEDKMAHDAGDLLSQDPSISKIRKSGSYGFDPVMRGFKYEQLNIVMNGSRGALAACPNRMDPPTSQIAPNMIDKIEILKGPHALRYGNAIGGTINFLSTPTKFSALIHPHGRFSAGYDSNGKVLRSEGMLAVSGEKIKMGIFGAWSQGTDYKDGNNNYVASGFLRNSFGSNLALKLSEHQQIEFTGQKNTARDADFAALPMDLRSDDTWLFNANHTYTFSSRKLVSWKSSAYSSTVDHRMDNYDKIIEPRMMDATTIARTNTIGGRSEGHWEFETASMYLGADINFENATGSRFRDFLMGPMAGNTVEDNVWQKGQILKSAVFTEYHIHRDKIQWIASGRLELNRSNVESPDDIYLNVFPETSALQIDPGFSIGGLYRINDQLSSGLWLGRVQRSGSMAERFINYFPVGLDPYEMLGNPQILPEINNQIDFNLTWKSSKTEIHTDFFAAYLQNLISSTIDPDLTPRLPSSPGVRVFDNLDHALKTGFEFTWSQLLPLNLQHHLSIAYSYGQNLVDGEPLPEIAPMDIAYLLVGSYFKGRFRPEIKYRYVLGQSRISTEYGETSTPAFQLLDTKLSYRISSAYKVSAGIRNLFDVAYYEHLSRSVRGSNDPIYSPGRCYFITVSAQFL